MNIDRREILVMLMAVIMILTGMGVLIVSNKEQDQHSCITEAQAIGLAYHWDWRYGCSLQINGHWWYVSGMQPALDPGGR